MNLEISRHRCFKIPKRKLDAFLRECCRYSDEKYFQCKMEYIFESEDVGYFDVVVSMAGSSAFSENQLRDYVAEIQEER